LLSTYQLLILSIFRLTLNTKTIKEDKKDGLTYKKLILSCCSTIAISHW